MLLTAYDVKSYQVSGPAWVRTERFHVDAKVSAGATKEQVRVMWQNLLSDRFGLKLHHESREFKIEDLVVGKDGSKLKPSVEDPEAASLEGPPKLDKNGQLDRPAVFSRIFPGPDSHAYTVAKGQSLSEIATVLGYMRNHPVIDKTGLTGKYDYTLDFRIVLPGPGGATPPEASDPGPDIPDAVQQQLGLMLVPSRAKIDVLVIDKAEKVPTDN